MTASSTGCDDQFRLPPMTEREAQIAFAVRRCARVQTGDTWSDLTPVLRDWEANPETIPVDFIRDRFASVSGLVLGFRPSKSARAGQ